MILPDVNVLIYAFRRDSERHGIAKQWLDSVVSGHAKFGISPLTLSAVVRIVTNPRVFREPDTIERAFAYCHTLMGQPHCEIVVPGERHWSIFESLCTATDTRGPRVTDAWFAALAIEHSCTWVTFDRDYARFPGLKWEMPGESSPRGVHDKAARFRRNTVTG
jgi:toxin-antitoxin system PIN domain toxin